ncbi:hypothetical protein HNP37_004720 [Flavobacterium nitrogenifigens]|uniref:Uncharacterized protein n=2 Tax=Flavobacterium TaxID=237 RepID=A0A7W7J1R4_9FLAO|nr:MULTISPECIES: hypothetical protein [Flavobacterium]MBB4804623.1 hypothetical protein [Flavobacterium nitrogenifigens]MBB6389582.1 hypothetical protein [Flavobacterium notoginsengisoli]
MRNKEYGKTEIIERERNNIPSLRDLFIDQTEKIELLFLDRYNLGNFPSSIK